MKKIFILILFTVVFSVAQCLDSWANRYGVDLIENDTLKNKKVIDSLLKKCLSVDSVSTILPICSRDNIIIEDNDYLENTFLVSILQDSVRIQVMSFPAVTIAHSELNKINNPFQKFHSSDAFALLVAVFIITNYNQTIINALAKWMNELKIPLSDLFYISQSDQFFLKNSQKLYISPYQRLLIQGETDRILNVCANKNIQSASELNKSRNIIDNDYLNMFKSFNNRVDGVEIQILNGLKINLDSWQSIFVQRFVDSNGYIHIPSLPHQGQ